MNQICLLRGLPDVTDFLVSVIREICDSDKHADTAPAVSIFQSPKSAIIRDSERPAINRTTTNTSTLKIRVIRDADECFSESEVQIGEGNNPRYPRHPRF